MAGDSVNKLSDEIHIAGAAQVLTAQGQSALLEGARNLAYLSHTELQPQPDGSFAGETNVDGRLRSLTTDTQILNESGVGHLITTFGRDPVHHAGSLKSDVSAVGTLSDGITEKDVTNTLRDDRGQTKLIADYKCAPATSLCTLEIHNAAGDVIARGVSNDYRQDATTTVHNERLFDLNGKDIGTLSTRTELDETARRATIDVNTKR